MNKIETKRLILREWTLEDAEDLYDYARDPRVGPSAGWPPHTDIEVSRSIIKGFIKEQEAYAIELKSTHKVIGGIGLHNKQVDKNLEGVTQREVGYVLHPDYWGKGYMTEAVEGILDYGFNKLNIDVIWCGHFDFNERSKRVVEKSGFKYNFTENRVLSLLEDKEVKCLCYNLTKEEYALLS